MAELWRTKGTLYLVAGAALVAFSAVTILVGVFYGSTIPPGQPGYLPNAIPIVGTICTAFGILPGTILIWRGLRARGLKSELVEFSSWVKTYRRISLAELARRLGKSEVETEKTLTAAIDRGMVRGIMDRTTDEFVLQEAMYQEVHVDFCPRCGGSVNRKYLSGETILCPYCGSVIPPGSTRPL